MNIFSRFSLSQRTVVITGASSGIGRAIALACAEAGATVAAIGRDATRLDALLAQLQAKNASAPHRTLNMDICDYETISNAIADIVKCCGRIGGFVHAAGVAKSVPLKVMDETVFQSIFSVNVFAGFEFAKAIAKKNNIADNASFLFISSVSARKGEPALLAYSASKGAVSAGIRSLAAELSTRGIRVNTLVPGQITDTMMGEVGLSILTDEARKKLTEKHPLGLGDVSCLDAIAVCLLSDAAKWITGSEFVVDGGYCL